MRLISWVTFVRKLWMNPRSIRKFVCRGTSVATWPCTSQFLKLGSEISRRDLNQAKTRGESELRFFFFLCTFNASSFSRNLGQTVGGHFFSFLHPSLNVLLSLFQITCQNFRSKPQKLDVILRCCPAIRASCPAQLVCIIKIKYLVCIYYIYQLDQSTDMSTGYKPPSRQENKEV